MKNKNYLKSMAGLASLVAAGMLLTPSLLKADTAADLAAINAQLAQFNTATVHVAILAAPKVGTVTNLAATGLQLQSAIAAALATGHTAADGATFVQEVLSTLPTNLARTTVGANVVNGALLGVAGLSPTPSDYVLIANAGASATYVSNPDTAAHITTAVTLQKNIILNVMKGTLISGVLVPPAIPPSTPSFTVANALAAYVSGTASGAGSLQVGTDQKVAILSAMITAMPLSTGSFFTPTQKISAIAALAGAVTANGNVSASDAGIIAGRLASSQTANVDTIAKSMALNLSGISDKVTFASLAGQQHVTATLLTDAVKSTIATGVSKTVSNGTDMGKVVAGVAQTMLQGDNPLTNTTTFPLDIRRAGIAVAVIKLGNNYTLARALVSEMLTVSPLDNAAGSYNGSAVPIAAKFATTLTAAIPAVAKDPLYTQTNKTQGIIDATVGINQTYANSTYGLVIKADVARAVINLNLALATPIAQAVVAETFTNTISGGWAGTMADKVNFVVQLVNGTKSRDGVLILDINRGLVAAGAALADPSLAGEIVLRTGTVATATTSLTNPDGVPTTASKVAIALSVAKSFASTPSLSGTLDSVIRDIAVKGAGFYTADPINQAAFASQFIAGIVTATGTTATSKFAPGYDPVTPIANAIANASPANANAFASQLAALQKTSAVRVGALVSAVSTVVGADGVTVLSGTVAVAAPLQAVAIATAATNYSNAHAIDIVSAVASSRGVLNTTGTSLFKIAADAAAGLPGNSTPELKAAQVALAAKALLDAFTATASNPVGTQIFQVVAVNIASTASTLSYLNDAGKATVAGAMASSLVGIPATVATNAANVADKLAAPVSSLAAKGDIAAAVIGAQSSATTSVVQKVVAQTALVANKAAIGAEIAVKQTALAGTIAVAVAKATGVAVTDAPNIASIIANGQPESIQRSIAFAVSLAQTAQAGNVAKAVLDVTLNDLVSANSYDSSVFLTTRANDFAQAAARYASLFAGSSVAAVSGASADAAGGAATRAAAGVAASNLNELAKVFGNTLASAASASKLANTTAPKIATALGTVLEANLGSIVVKDKDGLVISSHLTDEFAAVAVALTHFIAAPTGLTSLSTADSGNIAAILKALALIEPVAAPDMLGVILTDLMSRGMTLTKTSPLLATLKTAATATLATQKTKDNLTAVITDIFDGANGAVGTNPYKDFGAITGDETPVHNG